MPIRHRGIHLAQSGLEALPLGQRTTMIGDLASRVLEPIPAAELKRADGSAYRELLAQSSVKELTA